MIMETCATVLMIPCVVTDIKEQTLPLPYLIAVGLLGIPVSIFIEGAPWWSVAGGVAVGGVILLVGAMSRHGISYGDGWMVAAFGAWLGLMTTLSVLLAGLVFTGFFGVVCLIRHKGRKHRLPFAPFFAFGCLLATVFSFFSAGGSA